jgi:hypothetical protein
MKINNYTFWPSSGGSDVIFAKSLCNQVPKDQTRSPMNISKNAISMLETIPSGPFTSIGRFHMIVSWFFPLPLYMIQKHINVLDSN